MKEWVYRKGCEKQPNNIKLNWWQLICFLPFLDIISYDYRHFIELINEKGDIRRIYVKD